MSNLISHIGFRRRTVVGAGVAAFAAPMLARAQSYPAKPITLVVPFPAGGIVDLFARVYADPLSKALGTSVVVDNRAGAAGAIGSAAVARAKPDGYTLVVSSQSTHLAVPLVQPNAAYDPIKDFASIGQLARTCNALVVNPAVPAKTFAELVTLMKAHPGDINFCSAGPGSMGQLSVELLQAELKVKATHVPYKGGGAMLTGLIGNEVQFSLDGLGPFLPFIKSGKLRALALAAPSRIPLLPDVPTFEELGHASLNQTSWVGLAAPAKTPPEIIDKLSQAVSTVARQPAVLGALNANAAIAPENQTPAEFTAMMSRRLALYGDLVKRLGIRGE